MDERETLRAASEYISVNGHTKGSLYSFDGKVENQQPAACALGAIRQVTAVYDEFGLMVDNCDYYPATKHLAAYLIAAGYPGTGGDVIPKWNDRPERTAEEVILTLKRAAEE